MRTDERLRRKFLTHSSSPLLDSSETMGSGVQRSPLTFQAQTTQKITLLLLSQINCHREGGGDWAVTLRPRSSSWWNAPVRKIPGQ